MKNFIKWAAVGLAAVLAVPAMAQVTPNRVTTCVIPAVVAANTTSNVTSTAVSVPQGKGLSFIPTFAATGSSISNAVFSFQVSADGTTYTTTTPLTLTVVQNGTTTVTGWQLWDPTELNHVAWIKLVSVQTTHGTQALTNMSAVYVTSN